MGILHVMTARKDGRLLCESNLESYMIKKTFGKDFNSCEGALTLRVSYVTDTNAESGTHTKTHDSGWTITGNIIEDYYIWVNAFKAKHPIHGEVYGDFEMEVFAESEEGFQDFYKNHPPEAWDYMDI